MTRMARHRLAVDHMNELMLTIKQHDIDKMLHLNNIVLAV